MAPQFTLDEVRARTCKDRDAWWTVLLVDPVAVRLVRLVAPYRWITPNRLTTAAFVVGLGAAACFWQQSRVWLIAGALLFHVSFVLDCMDGKVARLTGNGSVFGAWMDYVFDRLRVVACTIGLMGGQYVRTGRIGYLLVGGLVIFLDMFRYLNALQIAKAKDAMRAGLTVAGGMAPVFLEETGHADPERPVVDVYRGFRSRFRRFVSVRDALVRRRIRPHLISGIEFQMAVFIVGPLTGWIAGTALVAAALLAAFEALLIYKLWIATRDAASQIPVQQGHVADRLEPGLGVQL
ncbi:MAG TPA: CDP-alcohol phosphatidyltransferase family protein [Actinoplanes sp.]